MLLSLSIKNFTLVEQLDIDFASGMTVITGETGAGKSLILDALAMALGDRADTDRIRRDADRLEVSASFSIDTIPDARTWLQQQDFDQGEDGECLLRRIVIREGRSKGYINGAPATMQQLRTLGEMLLDIHSQHEHQSLLRKDTHRIMLDNFADAQSLTKTVDSGFKAWHSTTQRLTSLTSQSDELAEKRQLLEFQLQELDQLALAEHELTELQAEHQLLANAESILRDSHALLALFEGESDFTIQQGLNQAQQLLNHMPSKPQALLEAEKIISSAGIEISEAAGEIRRHIDSFEINPERLQQLDERLSAIHELARKHRVAAGDLYRKHQEMRAELQALTGGGENIERLTEEVAQLAERYLANANQLSELRATAAIEFAEAVNHQLAQLSMKGATLTVSLSPNAENKFSATGLESVEFLIATNPGQAPGPLARIASGGELSRISLAIQVIAAQHSAIPTLLFDEVDVGIGGATADVVGRLLKELGENGQVICITHQPQVACCGHKHLLAEKLSSESGVESRLTRLDTQQRMNEIARMLGGAKITEKTLDHAREMIEMGT